MPVDERNSSERANRQLEKMYVLYLEIFLKHISHSLCLYAVKLIINVLLFPI